MHLFLRIRDLVEKYASINKNLLYDLLPIKTNLMNNQKNSETIKYVNRNLNYLYFFKLVRKRISLFFSITKGIC